MATGKFFLSYSTVEAGEFALRLTDALEAGPPSYPVWLDKRDIRPGQDWDDQIAEALRTCRGLLFVMTEDSVRSESPCKQEWSRALKYKKPIIPLRLDPDAETPFRLGSRQYIDFRDFTSGMARLRKHIAWMGTQEGLLAELKLRLGDARRTLLRTAEDMSHLVQAEIVKLQGEIDELERPRNPAADAVPAQSGTPTALRSKPFISQRASAESMTEILEGRYMSNARAASAHQSAISGRALTVDQLDALGLPNRVGMDPHSLGAELIAGTIVLDSSICDYEGVDLSSVVVDGVGAIDNIRSHPQYILADVRASTPPVPNRPKAHLVHWHAPVIDQGDIVTLEIARSDYWTSEATKRLVPRIQAEVLEGQIELLRMPRRLDVHLVVITEGDNMLLLTRRGDHLATEPSTWMISVGESMDWELDKGPDGVPHPIFTALRCLGDRDELNLPRALAESAHFRLVAIATEWTEMLVNLIVVARIPNIRFSDVRQYFRRGENSQLDATPFESESSVALLNSDSFMGSSGRGMEMPISDISRVALLATLKHVGDR
ncbi:MAG TPA: toll/interleukin-1 receptor domain-containing protein [Candidatus Limnocylindrales bacterium]|nr:toll/interleukin-1 receptor domain-containing protein [Candidatus Limnocylindrales bacterium]